MKTELNMQTRRLSELKPAEYNPRVRLQPDDPEYQKIKNSIERWGYVDPIIINSDGTIIGGHQRYTVLTDLGYTEAQVVIVDLDKSDEKALNIALNKISGEWDEVKLKDLLMNLDLENYDLSLTGFETEEIQELYIKLEQDIEPEEDDFSVGDALQEIGEPETQRGDLWILGDHRLLCGDSTDPDDVERLMAGEEADLVITDPPYNVNYEDKVTSLSDLEKHNFRNATRGDTNVIHNDNMSDSDFYEFLSDCFGCAMTIMKEGAPIYVFHADTQGLNFRQAFVNSGLKLSQILIWEKNHIVIGRQDYQWIHEPIIYGWKEGAGHYFINDRTQSTVLLEDDIDLEAMKKQDLITLIRNIQEDLRKTTSVIFENKPNKSNLHPTMKPVSLVGKLMKNSSRPGDKVADLFGGSGTTLIAAEQLNRQAFLMEYDEKYCDVIAKRWEEFTGKEAVRISSKEGLKIDI